MRRILMAGIVLILAASLVGCGGKSEPTKGVRAKPASTKLRDAYTGCQPISSKIELGDGNHSLLVNGALGDDYTGIACMMLALNTPEYIVSEIDNTTAMMGRQHEEDGGITYEWSYHPDNGLDMVIHEDS